jgi:hypothetical protein
VADEEIAGRYAPTYREAELSLICDMVQRGQSLAFVGVSGVGKSNLVNFLHEGGAVAAGLFRPGENVRFATVACNRWNHTPAGLWELLLQSLGGLAGFPEAPADPVPALNDATGTLRRLQAWIQLACRDQSDRLVLILDHFDRVLELGPLAMLEDMAMLRNDGARERLSYVIFTNRLPHALGRSHNLESQSKFYDLFRRHIYALEPHQPRDALALLAHLNTHAEPQLSHRELQAVYGLAGGHARLLKVIFSLWAERKAAGLALPSDPEELQLFPEVSDTCGRILSSLHKQEQVALLRAALDGLQAEDLPTADHLTRRGILKSVRPPVLFSPVVASYLRHCQREGEPT